MVHVVAGGAAGAVASAFTTPLDVIKTLLNTQETGIGLTKGMKGAISQVCLTNKTFIAVVRIRCTNFHCFSFLYRFMQWLVRLASSED